MVELSISVEGWFGLTWPDWKRLVREVEDLGFAGLYLSDHFVFTEPPHYPSLELIVALTYLADHTEHVRFGSMVSPLSVRDPVLLARQAATLGDLSDGRMILGVGAGWAEHEHAMYGYALGDLSTRFNRFEEGLEVITRLLHTEAPVDFDGQFFQLKQAVLPPPRSPKGPPIMIGGNGLKRTLPLVARFADVWNAQIISPDQVRDLAAVLNGLLEAVGRRPEDVRRTLNVPVLCWRTPAELQTRLRSLQRYPEWRDLSAEQMVEILPGLVGTPKEVATQIRAYGAAGIDEISMQWTAADDIEGLEALAVEVLQPLALTTS